MRFDLELIIGPIHLRLKRFQPTPSIVDRPPGIEASGGGIAELSDQFPLGFGPSMATERDSRY